MVWDKLDINARTSRKYLRQIPWTMELPMIIDLLLKKLLGRSHGLIIFPLYAFLATRSTLPMGHILPRWFTYDHHGSARLFPTSSVVPIPVVTPTMQTSKSCSLGPVQTLLESLNNSISGGQRSRWQAADWFAPWDPSHESVFVPLVFVKGIVGKLFTELALTLSFSIVISAFVALTLSPMLASKYLKVSHSKPNFLKKFDSYLDKFSNFYFETLLLLLYKKKEIVIFLVGVLISVIILFKITPKELIPPEDRGVFYVVIQAPDGSGFKFRVQGSGFRVRGLGFKVWGLDLRQLALLLAPFHHQIQHRPHCVDVTWKRRQNQRLFICSLLSTQPII